MKNRFISLLSPFKKILLLYIKGARIKTLPASLIPIAMAGAWSGHQTGILRKDILIFTALSAMFIQIAVNLFNDALDFKEGLDSSLRKGPSRLAQTGQAPFSQIRQMGILSCILSLLLAVPLILRGGLPILIVGALSLFLAYFYTSGRFSLLKTGMAELACFIFFGPVAVFGTYYLQSLQLSSRLIYLGIQCGLWSLSILLINFLRDEQEDRKAGRKHFVTIYGRTHSLFFLSVIQAFIYLLCFYWLNLNLNSGAFSFFVLPLSSALLYFIGLSPPSKKYNFYLFACSMLYLLFGLLWILGLVI